MDCTNCGASLKAGAKFCPHCAFDLSQAAQNRAMAETQVLQPRACANCGAALTEGARFCMNCATPVGAGPGHQGPVYGGQPAAQAPAHNNYNSYPVAHVQRNLKPFIIGAAILGLLIGAALASYFLFFSGSGGPSDVARRYVRALENANGNEMLNLLSKGQLAKMGIDRTNEAQVSIFNAGLAEAAADIKSKGGVAQVETANEKITGETATVDVTVKPGQGEAKTRTLRLIREDGQWKIDELPGAGAQSSSEGPAEVGERAFKAIEGNDEATLRGLMASSMQDSVSDILQEGNANVQKNGIASIVKKGETVQPDRASVRYDLAWVNGGSRSFSLDFVKENNEWKVTDF